MKQVSIDTVTRSQLSWLRLTLLVVLFVLLWVGAWLVHNSLGVFGVHLVTGSVADTVYWITAKFLVWVVFPFLFFAQPLGRQLAFIGLRAKDIRRGLVYGATASLLWLALSALRFFLTHQHFAFTTTVFIAFHTVILTPIFEEIMFRGYIQSALATLKTHFLLANLITTLLFLVPHCIGWSFQGVLPARLTIGEIGAIALVSLVLGFVRYASNSLAGNILLHSVNNLISIFVY